MRVLVSAFLLSGAANAAEPVKKPLGALVVAVFAANAAFAHAYLAQSEGYFEKEGLNVTLQSNTGSNTLNVVVSGQADLGMIGVGAPLLAAKSGKPTSIVFAHIGNAAGGTVVGRPGITSLAGIKNVGATGIGSSSYGFCNHFKQAGHANWNIVVVQDIPTLQAALASGRIDGACNTYVNFRAQIDSKAVNVLIDTRDPATRRKYVGEDYPEAGVFGITANLRGKREAMVAFMRAIGNADKFLQSNPPQSVAASMRKLSAFSSMQVDQVATQVQDSMPFFAPNRGYIDKAVWDFALKQYRTWGLAIEPDDPTFSYGQRIDMSYYEAGIGKPARGR